MKLTVVILIFIYKFYIYKIHIFRKQTAIQLGKYTLGMNKTPLLSSTMFLLEPGTRCLDFSFKMYFYCNKCSEVGYLTVYNFFFYFFYYTYISLFYHFRVWHEEMKSKLKFLSASNNNIVILFSIYFSKLVEGIISCLFFVSNVFL